MRALSGDLDICGRSLEISDISILKESEARETIDCSYGLAPCLRILALALTSVTRIPS